MHVWTPKCTPFVIRRTIKVNSSVLKHVSHKRLTILCCEVMKQNWSIVECQEQKEWSIHWKEPPWHGSFLAMRCGSFTSSGTENLQRDEFNQVSGNARWKYYTVWDKAEAWKSLDLPGGHWSQAYCQIKQGLVSEVLHDSMVAISHLAWTLLEISVGIWRRQHAISAVHCLREGMRFLKNTTRSQCLAVHHVCIGSYNKCSSMYSWRLSNFDSH